MIGWTRLVAATAWIMSASLSCAGATPTPSAPSTPQYLRSPPLDYGEGPRSAADGDIMGAHQRPAQDWLLGNATSAHPAPGWSMQNGQPRFTLEQVGAGYGTTTRAPACPPSSRPLAPGEAEADAALLGAWLRRALDPPLTEFAIAVADVPEHNARFLTCDSR
jgi:hypothetical protein